MDVVPTADPAYWTHAPFAAVREGDWLFGRGAGDMKAGLAANLFAVDAIEAAGFELQGPLEFQSVIDEEVTGNGTAAAILRGATADAVLIPEPTDEDVVCANSGVIKFRITVQGVSAHPREPDSGLSAIEAAFLVINELKVLEARWNAEKNRARRFRPARQPGKPQYRHDPGWRVAGLDTVRMHLRRPHRLLSGRRTGRENGKLRKRRFRNSARWIRVFQRPTRAYSGSEHARPVTASSRERMPKRPWHRLTAR
ncbi:M20/M25/M40 family metallo-hydrolase [Roseibium salinum]|nr:M20/M25/M40 family metallo-hydrolase [Roseibium salinum]